MTKQEAYKIASSWGSYMREGDPGACFYSFPVDDGRPESEEHRTRCLAYLDSDLIPHAKRDEARLFRDRHGIDAAAYAKASADLAELKRLRQYYMTAPTHDDDTARMGYRPDFVDGYITCALWLGCEELDGNGCGESLEREDLSEATLKQLEKEAEDFFDRHESDILCDGGPKGRDGATQAEMAGHDLWLNRNGHSSGYWDGDWPEPQATRLDKAAKELGENYLYRSDDGTVYLNR